MKWTLALGSSGIFGESIAQPVDRLRSALVAGLGISNPIRVGASTTTERTKGRKRTI